MPVQTFASLMPANTYAWQPTHAPTPRSATMGILTKPRFAMSYTGSCHCGAVRFSVEGEIDQVIDCNCSHCSRKGFLLWFVPREQLQLETPESGLATYTFNKHAIQHRFCPTCGVQPFGFGSHNGAAVAAINARCLEQLDLKSLKTVAVDGRSS